MDDLAHSRDLLARVREAIRGGRYWVLVTDDRGAGGQFRLLAAALTIGGADAEEVISAEPELVVAGPGVRLWFAVLAVAKTCLSAERVAGFAARLSGAAYGPLLASVRGGCDLLPMAVDADATAGFIQQIVTGDCYAADPNAN